MKCPFCDETFVVELDFRTFFCLPVLCPRCHKLTRTEPVLEVIPTTNGEIHYFSLIPDFQKDKERLERLQPFLSQPLENALSRESSDAVVLWIDTFEYATFPSWFPALSGYRIYQFISLYAFDFSRYYLWI